MLCAVGPSARERGQMIAEIRINSGGLTAIGYQTFALLVLRFASAQALTGRAFSTGIFELESHDHQVQTSKGASLFRWGARRLAGGNARD